MGLLMFPGTGVAIAELLLDDNVGLLLLLLSVPSLAQALVANEASAQAPITRDRAMIVTVVVVIAAVDEGRQHSRVPRMSKART